ncbi:hypothetical protein Noda2021_03750 [Candidatus Dependentiae bacterium Noda2021]|nr:hypothetical protein Noda2021_03750 [Candidatus Dependentiae bacterium Noda2021]
MKLNVFVYLIALLSLNFTCQVSYAAVDCLSNKNEDINDWFDSKNYRLVRHVHDGKSYPCTCPCEKYGMLDDRGKCARCGHFHDGRPLIIVKAKQLAQRAEPAKIRRVSAKDHGNAIKWNVTEELPFFQ